MAIIKQMDARQKFISPVLMWSIVIFGIFFSFWFLPERQIFYRNIYTMSLMIPAALYWAVFFLGALWVHRKLVTSVAGIEKIVTYGVYGLVRHPIYSGDIVLAWGIFFYWPSLQFFVSVVWLTVVLFGWMKLEEKGLIDKFGSEYIEYSKKVPMFIPRIFNM